MILFSIVEASSLKIPRSSNQMILFFYFYEWMKVDQKTVTMLGNEISRKY